MANNNKRRAKVKGILNYISLINQGEKDGRHWSLYEVSINNEKYRTFDRSYADFVNKEGEWEYEEEDRVSSKGTKYTSKTLLPLRRNGQNYTLILQELHKINEKLDRVVEFFVSNQHKDEPEPEDLDEVPPPDDVPF